MGFKDGFRGGSGVFQKYVGFFSGVFQGMFKMYFRDVSGMFTVVF